MRDRRSILRGLAAAPAALALAASMPAVTAREADPVFAAIAAHKEAYRHMTQDFVGHEDDDDPVWEAAVGNDCDMWRKVSDTEPTTLAGIAALAIHVAEYPDADDLGLSAAATSLANACRKLIPIT